MRGNIHTCCCSPGTSATFVHAFVCLCTRACLGAAPHPGAGHHWARRTRAEPSWGGETTRHNCWTLTGESQHWVTYCFDFGASERSFSPRRICRSHCSVKRRWIWPSAFTALGVKVFDSFTLKLRAFHCFDKWHPLQPPLVQGEYKYFFAVVNVGLHNDVFCQPFTYSASSFFFFMTLSVHWGKQ